MNLYLLTTRGLGEFYMVANDPTEAEGRLQELLARADYGIRDKRQVINIQWLATEIGTFREKPFFSSGNKLILLASCEPKTTKP